jgi:predicted aspartyl protease
MPVLLILLSALSLAGCEAGPEPGCRLERLAELPIEVVDNVPVVPVEINGRPARMVIDTGSDSTVLTRAAALRLGVAEGVGTRSLRGAGGAETVGNARLATLRIGADLQKDIAVSIVDMQRLKADGLLGIDVLVDYELDLDVPNHRAGFYRARSCASARPDFPAGIIQLPARPQAGSGHMFVSLSVDGQPLRGMLDSGASTSTLSVQSAEDTGLNHRRLERLTATRGQALNRNGLVIRQATFREMQIGIDRMEHPRLTIADLPVFAGDVLVGEDYIGTRRIWFSFRIGRVFVAAPR